MQKQVFLEDKVETLRKSSLGRFQNGELGLARLLWLSIFAIQGRSVLPHIGSKIKLFFNFYAEDSNNRLIPRNILNLKCWGRVQGETAF